MTTKTFLTACGVGILLVLANALYAAEVNISEDIERVLVKHGDQMIPVSRNQDQNNTVNPAFARTSRQCPPFCVQPAIIAPGVDTIAELEVLQYLKRIADGDDSVLVIDSREPAWVAKGTIPGSINIPWTHLNASTGADPISIGEILQNRFNAENLGGLWRYTEARTLVLFCNGMWCEQASESIRNLLGFGYPAHKIKWYRGGMQSWEILSLTTVKPVQE